MNSSEYILFPIPIELDQEKIDLVYKVRLLCLHNLEKLTAKFFLGLALVNQDKITCKEWAVCRYLAFFKTANLIIPPGGWINKKTKVYGFDLISLYSMLSNNDYFSSANIILEYIEKHSKAGKSVQKKRAHKWVQELYPLAKPLLKRFEGNIDKNLFFYKNNRGLIIGAVEYKQIYPYVNYFVKYYHTIWKSTEAEDTIFWMNLFPQPPYTIFNADLIEKNKQAQVIFVTDEPEVTIIQKKEMDLMNSKMPYLNLPLPSIFSTCPGGLINLNSADFSILSDRVVTIKIKNMDDEIIQHMPYIIKRLKDNNVKWILLAYDKNEYTPADSMIPFYQKHIFISGDIFMLYPYLCGYKGIMPINDNVEDVDLNLSSTNDKQTIVKHRISKKIKEMAMISFLHEHKKMSYKKIQEKTQISSSTAFHIFTNQIPKLNDKDKLKFNTELNRLINSDGA